MRKYIATIVLGDQIDITFAAKNQEDAQKFLERLDWENYSYEQDIYEGERYLMDGIGEEIDDEEAELINDWLLETGVLIDDETDEATPDALLVSEKGGDQC